MRNFFIIARREYMERVKTKSFIIMTILLPVLMFAVSVVPTLLLMRSSNESKHLAVVVSNPALGEILRDQLNSPPDSAKDAAQAGGLSSRSSQPKINFIVDVSTDTSDAQHAALVEKVKEKQLDGVIFATDEALAARKVSFYTLAITSFSMQEVVRSAVTQAVRRGFLASKGLTPPEIDTAFKSVQVDAHSPRGTGNPVTVFFTVFTLVMIMYVTVLMYGINVMRAILEEKTSRVMEVMLASARPLDMMAGKIVGVGAVGLTQIAIWATAGTLYTSLSLVSSGADIKGILSGKLLIFLGVFFLLGYALYSTLCAAIGAMVNTDQEAQQLQFVVMLPLIISIVLISAVLQAPNGAIAVGASLFPLTAPIIMFMRIAIEMPPWWQIILSMALMIATAVGLVFLCARIYRVGILMYGKRPTLPEIVKWIKYA